MGAICCKLSLHEIHFRLAGYRNDDEGSDAKFNIPYQRHPEVTGVMPLCFFKKGF